MKIKRKLYYIRALVASAVQLRISQDPNASPPDKGSFALTNNQSTVNFSSNNCYNILGCALDI